MRFLAIIILFIALLSSNLSTAGDGFRRPFQLGDYYEYLFIHYGGFPPDTFRYSARVLNDTLVDGVYVSEVKVYNEPAMGDYTIIYKFDTTSLSLYGGSYGCANKNGDHLTTGFSLPIGYVWNTCSDTVGGVYFKSEIVDTTTISQLFGFGISIKLVGRKDTVGAPIDGTTFHYYGELFGLLRFYRGYGSPLGPFSYEKLLIGAVIDSVTYGSVILGIQQTSLEIPAGYSLSQNYPNPFNPATTIEFDIPIKENVRLVVYDQLGREVRELVNESLSPGSYEYQFTANNLSSGLYYYTLQTGNYSQTKKMLLVK